jgi:hypothetical protein
VITGRWASDNNASTPFVGFNAWTNFSFTVGTTGAQVLTFDLTNGTTGTSLTGLRVEFNQVPEPMSCALAACRG